MNIEFNFQPVQKELYKKYEYGTSRIIGFGGSRGGTKSYTTDMVLILRRIKYPGTNGLLVMKVYQDIWDIHLTPLFLKYPDLRNMFNVQQMMLTFPNKSYIRFLSGDSLKEFEERKGREFSDVMIDQSELFTQKEIESLSTINRSTNLDITPKMLLCFNPGGISHSYNKRLFFEHSYEGNEVASDYDFVQTFGWDNAYWSLKNLIYDGLTIEDYHKWDSKTRFEYFRKTNYGKILDVLPDSKRKAELLGDMDIFEGMFFSEFRRSVHVINYKMENSFTRIAGLDYGNKTALEVLERDYEGTIAVAKEWYDEDLGNPSARANAIADFLLSNFLFKLRIIYDTDMDISQISNVGYDKTPISIFRQVFKERMGENAPMMVVVSKTSLDKNKNYREAVNDAIHEFLKIDSEGKSHLYFNSECKVLIKEISTLIHPPEDADGRDYLNSGPTKPHAIDAFKMPFYAIYTPHKKEEPKKETPRQAAHRLATKTKTISSF